MKLIYSFFLLIGTLFLASQEHNIDADEEMLPNKTYTSDLISKERQKFKDFETKLKRSKKAPLEKQNQLKSYTRDSLQILTVKLFAIKVLDEKKLLNRDIAENTKYYQNLLIELKKSTINQADYFFLEERVNYIIAENLEERVQQSNWLIYGLAFLVLLLIVVIVWLLKKKYRKVPDLSKQETTIKNLIQQGKSNKEIASELFISLSTVKSHITNIYSKLNVRNRRELLQKSPGTST